MTDLVVNRLMRFPRRGLYGSQRAPGIHLSLPPQCWDHNVYCHIYAGDSTQVITLACKPFTESPSQTREIWKTLRDKHSEVKMSGVLGCESSP